MVKFEQIGINVNFVDNNDVAVGYSLQQDCCEYADWFISEKYPTELVCDKTGNVIKEDHDISNFNFDKEYFKEEPLKGVEGEASVIFRLVGKFGTDKEGQELFLCIFNSHNGYYGHGFTVKISGQIIKEGCL